MRRIFTERARLVVYVESEAADRMTEKARGEGKTVVEWMRETLLAELEDNSGVRPEPAVRVAKRRVGAPERPAPAALSAHNGGSKEPVPDGLREHGRSAKTCNHGTPKGWRCWQCGGIAVIE